MGKIIETADGGGHFTEVVSRPHVAISEKSDANLANEIHHKAHELCFIANSVNFPVRAEGKITVEKSVSAAE
jgi:organic hydroperoxide reductase OsmC/OhrA